MLISISVVVRASDCQCTSCNSPEFDPGIRRHSGIWGEADEPVLNIVRHTVILNTWSNTVKNTRFCDTSFSPPPLLHNKGKVSACAYKREKGKATGEEIPILSVLAGKGREWTKLQQQKKRARLFRLINMKMRLCATTNLPSQLRFPLLKVHKNENFFGFDFEFCTISLLVMSKY